jgi:hypothetical protein
MCIFRSGIHRFRARRSKPSIQLKAEFFPQWQSCHRPAALVIYICATVLVPVLLHSASTGKIAGRVTDAGTGEPLPAANVIIEGAQLGAATDMNGEYFIINLLPRTYTVKASMMGYVTLVQTEVIVSQDHTTPLDFQLESTILEAAGEVIVIADREIVRMDQSSASHTVSAEAIENTAYGGDFDQVFMSQPGWGDWVSPSSQALRWDPNRFGVRAGTGEDRGFEVRGGGEWEVNLMAATSLPI